MDTYMDTSEMHDLMNRTDRIMKRCFSEQLTNQGKCHFGMLHRLHYAIEKKGQDGSIYVSQLAKLFYDTPQAVSRSLRTLEQDGLIERFTDPKDRRKTIVRLTQAGLEAHRNCEDAILEYSAAIFRRLGSERLHRLYEDHKALLEALEAESMEREQRKAGKTE